jgi:hypothetical protein
MVFYPDINLPMVGNKEFAKDTEINSLIKNIFEYTEYVFTEKTSHGLEFK